MGRRPRIPADAERFVAAIFDYWESLADMPGIGSARDEFLPGLRIAGYRRRVAMAFTPADPNRLVIVAVFYGGQDDEPRLTEGH